MKMSRKWFWRYTTFLIVVLLVVLVTSCGNDKVAPKESYPPGATIVDLPNHYPDLLRWCEDDDLYVVTHVEKRGKGAGGGGVAIITGGCVDGVPK